jgi:hypothetical protein
MVPHIQRTHTVTGKGFPFPFIMTPFAQHNLENLFRCIITKTTIINLTRKVRSSYTTCGKLFPYSYRKKERNEGKENE